MQERRLVTRATNENSALVLVAPAVIWLLLLAGERPKEEPLGRGRWGDFAEVS